MTDGPPIRRVAFLGRDYTDQELEEMVAFIRGEDSPASTPEPDPDA